MRERRFREIPIKTCVSCGGPIRALRNNQVKTCLYCARSGERVQEDDDMEDFLYFDRKWNGRFYKEYIY